MAEIAQADPAGAHGIDLVRCRAGGIDVALPAARVLGLGIATNPDTPSLAALLGLTDPPGARPRPRLLCIAGAGANGGVLSVRVDEPVAQLHLPASAIHPVPPLLAARLKLPYLRALALTPEPVALLCVLVPRP